MSSVSYTPLEMREWLQSEDVEVVSDTPPYDRFVILECGRWFLERVPSFRTHGFPGPRVRRCPDSDKDRCRVLMYVPCR
jgi:hypothetical protein